MYLAKLLVEKISNMMIFMFIIVWIYQIVNFNVRLMKSIYDLVLDWYAEPSMIFSGYTHTASATESSKHVR
jgi:hypothetical protein